MAPVPREGTVAKAIAAQDAFVGEAAIGWAAPAGQHGVGEPEVSDDGGVDLVLAV